MYLKPADARLLFSVRSGTLDLKTLRKYNYEEADVLCRLCGKEEETADHIICMMVTRTEIIYDVYSLEREHVEIVVARIKMFLKLAEEKKVMEENKDKYAWVHKYLQPSSTTFSAVLLFYYTIS